MHLRGLAQRAIVFLVLMAGISIPALADTGGSMGGGDWGGGGGGGGGGYSSSSDYSSSSSSSDYSYSSDYSSSNNYSSSDGSSTPLNGFHIVGGLVILVAWGVIQLAMKNSRGGFNYASTYHASSYIPMDSVDVSVLRIALDGRARKFVQSELAKIAKTADTKTSEGRIAMLREVSLMLRRVRDAWVYGGAVNEPMRSLSAAKPVFDRHVDDARSRFRTETIRNVQGTTTTTHAPDFIPRSEEGAGVILVSIIVCARTELFTVKNIGTGEDLRKALEAAPHRAASDLVAIEIVWQPSEETDRMSSMELEAKYPHPELIPITGALVGKTFCEYCGGPFPAELVSCPHCGAPARDAQKAA
ncbi:MAG: DUF1517 domain-containing protein [Kofleriaceae bacterium]